MAKVKAHHVQCEFCHAVLYVHPEAQVCPRCLQAGMLGWVNDAIPEVEVEAEKVETAPEESEG